MARPPHEVTPETSAEVVRLAEAGIRREDIARVLGICENTLRTHYGDLIDVAATEANAKVAKSLFSQALEGNTAAAVFWLKARAGWREKQEIAITVQDIAKALEHADTADLTRIAGTDPGTGEG